MLMLEGCGENIYLVNLIGNIGINKGGQISSMTASFGDMQTARSKVEKTRLSFPGVVSCDLVQNNR